MTNEVIEGDEYEWATYGALGRIILTKRGITYGCEPMVIEHPEYSCADVRVFPLLETSNLTGAKVSKALPNLAGKPKGNKSMD